MDGRPWYYSNIPWPTRYSNRQRLGVRGTRSAPSSTGGSPRSWEKGVSIMVWKTYLVVASCSAHFLPHQSSYSELLECAAHRPWTCHQERQRRHAFRSGSPGFSLGLTVWYGFREVQVDGVGPVGERSMKTGSRVRKRRNDTQAGSENAWGSINSGPRLSKSPTPTRPSSTHCDPPATASNEQTDEAERLGWSGNRSL